LVTKDHICVCICTYKRPYFLKRLLSELEKQETEARFDYSIVIVDNDKCESARQTVETYAHQSMLKIRYFVEPVQNIALARNKAIENASGELIALIDDDEYPCEGWLVALHKAIKGFSSDGVLGPVLPHYEKKPPNWVLKGRFFDRPSHPNGNVLGWENTRTGNGLLRKDLFLKGSKWFDPAFGSGGEDRDFFRRRIGEGCVFVWCREAVVFETVTQNRWKRRVLMKRGLLRGKMALAATKSKPLSVLSSLAAATIYTACLPLLFVMGHHFFMKYLVKDCDHLGKVLASLNVDWVKEKYVSG
jgi:succinoglycan biosynthesis protein ExoM